MAAAESDSHLAATRLRLDRGTLMQEGHTLAAGARAPAALRVLVIGMGGTIAVTTTGTGGVAPTLAVRQLVDAVPGRGFRLVGRGT